MATAKRLLSLMSLLRVAERILGSGRRRIMMTVIDVDYLEAISIGQIY